MRGKLCRRIDHGRRMNERLERRLRMKQPQRTRVSEVWIARTKDGDVAPRFDAGREIDRGGARRLHTRRVTRRGEKGDVPRFGFIKPGRARDLKFAVAFDCRACLLSEF